MFNTFRNDGAVTGCNRTPQARAGGLCAAHYKHKRRGVALDAPVRDRDRPVVSTRVARATKAALAAEANRREVPVYRVAADVLDGWAARK